MHEILYRVAKTVLCELYTPYVQLVVVASKWPSCNQNMKRCTHGCTHGCTQGCTLCKLTKSSKKRRCALYTVSGTVVRYSIDSGFVSVATRVLSYAVQCCWRVKPNSRRTRMSGWMTTNCSPCQSRLFSVPAVPTVFR